MTNVKHTIDNYIERITNWHAFWDLGSDGFASHARDGIMRDVNDTMWDQIVDGVHNRISTNVLYRRIVRLGPYNIGFISQ